MEMWKNIIGYPDYQISNLGNVKSLGFNYFGKNNKKCVSNPKILKLFLNKKNNYLGIRLRNNKILKSFTIHRLVAFAFIPNPENKRTVNHINGIRTDNRVLNLEWNTYSENISHSYKKLNRNGINAGKSQNEIFGFRNGNYKVNKIILNENSPQFQEALKYIGDGGTLDMIEKKYQLSETIKLLLIS